MKLVHPLIALLPGSKIGFKLTAAFLFFIILPLAFVLTYFQNRVTVQMLMNVNFYNDKAFAQTNEMLSYQLEKISETVTSSFINTDFLPIVSRDREGLDNNEILGDVRKINNIFNSMKSHGEILDVFFYLPAADPLSDHFEKYGTLESVINTEWFSYLQNRPIEAPWVLSRDNEGNHVISMTRNIYSTNDYETIIAVLRIELNTKRLNSVLQNAISTPGTIVFLLNTQNEVILSSYHNNEWPYKDEIGIFLNSVSVDSKSSRFTLDGRNVFASLWRTSRPDWYRPNWTLLSITPLEDIQGPINSITRGCLFVTIISAIVFFIFSFIFTSSIIRRINSLISGMRKAQDGNFAAMIIPKGSDEITELTADFNYMIKQTELLLRENANHIRESRLNELAALQSQINPHFLYNTLDLINWNAVNYNIPEIYETVQALSRFYKLSLNQGKNIVPLSDEIRLVEAYLEIQRRRFDCILNWQISIPESLMDHSIAKLTLQPLVENSLIHGILKKPSKNGMVEISITEEEDLLEIRVRDDGIGIPGDKLQSMQKNQFGSGGGYGLPNIHERLQLYFGQKFGLRIEGKEGEYTAVYVRLPKVKYNDDLY